MTYRRRPALRGLGVMTSLLTDDARLQGTWSDDAMTYDVDEKISNKQQTIATRVLGTCSDPYGVHDVVIGHLVDENQIKLD